MFYRSYDRAKRYQCCPLCRKRTWDRLKPLTADQLVDEALCIRQRENRLMIVTRAFVARCDLHEWLGLGDDGSVINDRHLLFLLGVANMNFYITDDEEIDDPFPIPRGAVDPDGDPLSATVTEDEESTV